MWLPDASESSALKSADENAGGWVGQQGRTPDGSQPLRERTHRTCAVSPQGDSTVQPLGGSDGGLSPPSELLGSDGGQSPPSVSAWGAGEPRASLACGDVTFVPTE